MHKYFTLTEKDREFIKIARGDANKIGIAIQLCTIKFIGFIPENFSDLSKSFIRYVAKQLDVDWNDFYNYGQREQTRTEHLGKIIDHLNFKYYDSEYEKKFQLWLNERALEHDSLSVLLSDAFKKLHGEKYLRPALTTIEKCISIARQEALKFTYEAIKHIITDNNKRFCNKILSQHDEIENITYLRWLALRETSNTVASIKIALEKLEFLKKFKVHKWFVEGINPNRKRYLARIAKCSTPSILEKVEEKRKYQILVFFLLETYDGLVDEIVEIFMRLMFDKYRQCKRQVRELREKNAKSINEKILAFITMGKIQLNPGIRDSRVRKKIFEKIPREKLQAMLSECKEIIRPKDCSIWDFYLKKYSQIKMFYPDFIKNINFYTNENSKMKSIPLALSILKRVCAGNWDTIPKNAPIDFINKSWSQFVFDKKGIINKKYYELCVLWNLRLGLKHGEIWTERGRNLD